MKGAFMWLYVIEVIFVTESAILQDKEMFCDD